MKKKNKRKKIVTAVCALVGAGVLVAGIWGVRVLFDVRKYNRIIDEIIITTPNVSLIPDGVYNGAFNALLVAADVDVTVRNGEITEIAINNHHHGRKEALEAESITDSVILQQSLEVDTVSGATNSSLVILKAIELALSGEVSETVIDTVSGATENGGDYA